MIWIICVSDEVVWRVHKLVSLHLDICVFWRMTVLWVLRLVYEYLWRDFMYQGFLDVGSKLSTC